MTYWNEYWHDMNGWFQCKLLLVGKPLLWGLAWYTGSHLALGSVSNVLKLAIRF